MAEGSMTMELSAESRAAAMRDYMREGEARALGLGNRGPLRFGPGGAVHHDILAAYWRCGFYVFEGVIGEDELAELRADVERVVAGAPVEPGARRRPRAAGHRRGTRAPLVQLCSAAERPAGGHRPLPGAAPRQDAGADAGGGRPERTVELLLAHLQIMDSSSGCTAIPGSWPSPRR